MPVFSSHALLGLIRLSLGSLGGKPSILLLQHIFSTESAPSVALCHARAWSSYPAAAAGQSGQDRTRTAKHHGVERIARREAAAVAAAAAEDNERSDSGGGAARGASEALVAVETCPGAGAGAGSGSGVEPEGVVAVETSPGAGAGAGSGSGVEPEGVEPEGVSDAASVVVLGVLVEEGGRVVKGPGTVPPEMLTQPAGLYGKRMVPMQVETTLGRTLAG
jgi:hypothetical protein